MSNRRGRQRAAYLGPSRRRPAVLEAASQIFAECGYGGARMEAIAARAGVRKPVVYDCFPGGKEEIFRAALTRAAEAFERHRKQTIGSAPGMSLEEALRWELTAFMEFARVEPSALPILLERPATSEEAIVERCARARKQVVEGVEARLRPYLGNQATQSAPLYAQSIVATVAVVAGRRTPIALIVEPLVGLFIRGFASMAKPPLELRRRSSSAGTKETNATAAAASGGND